MRPPVKSGTDAMEAKAILREMGINSLRKMAGYIPAETTASIQYPIFRMPIPVRFWEQLPDEREMSYYTSDLKAGNSFLSAFWKWRIYDGFVMKFAPATRFLRPGNHELIEIHNLELVALWLVHVKARRAPEIGG